MNMQCIQQQNEDLFSSLYGVVVVRAKVVAVTYRVSYSFTLQGFTKKVSWVL